VWCILNGMSLRWLTVFLDFPADSFDAGVAFWREATGSGASPVRGPASEFATLLPPTGDAYLRVQRVVKERVAQGGGGYHLDLHIDTATRSLSETAAQAEALGARIQLVGDGLIVTDSPGGFTFCLVPWRGETVVPKPLVTDGGAASRLDALCLDIPPADFERECSFWTSLTGFGIRPARVPGFFYLSGQAGMPVLLLFQRLDSADPGQRVRAHADIGTADRDQAVARHVALGATIVAAFSSWTVLADPAGHRYCLVSRDPDIARRSGSVSSG
jgi:hypothetical protein